VKYAWIDGQRKRYPLDEMCRVLEVSESGYRAWKRGGKPVRKRLTDAQMLALIRGPSMRNTTGRTAARAW
jgi:putative transposase